MNSLVQKIDQVRLNAEKLHQLLLQEKKTCSTLEKENAELKKALETEKNTSKELNNTIKMLKLAKSIGTTDTKEKTIVKRKINEFIREIDKCIALLNS